MGDMVEWLCVSEGVSEWRVIMHDRLLSLPINARPNVSYPAGDIATADYRKSCVGGLIIHPARLQSCAALCAASLQLARQAVAWRCWL